MSILSYQEFRKYIAEILIDLEELVEEIIESEYENYHRNRKNTEIIFIVNNIKVRHKEHHHKKRSLQPATHLKATRVVVKQSKKRRGKAMSTEVYKLSWNKSVSVNAVSQDVTIIINGLPFGHPGIDMTTEFLTETFPTDAVVEWFVTTHGDTGAVAESLHATFTAVNGAPTIEPATGLTQEFIQHNP